MELYRSTDRQRIEGFIPGHVDTDEEYSGYSYDGYGLLWSENNTRTQYNYPKLSELTDPEIEAILEYRFANDKPDTIITEDVMMVKGVPVCIWKLKEIKFKN